MKKSIKKSKIRNIALLPHDGRSADIRINRIGAVTDFKYRNMSGIQSSHLVNGQPDRSNMVNMFDFQEHLWNFTII